MVGSTEPWLCAEVSSVILLPVFGFGMAEKGLWPVKWKVLSIYGA